MALVSASMSALSTKVEVPRLPTTASCSWRGPRCTTARAGVAVTTTRHDWWQAIVEARKDAGGALGVNAIAVAAQSDGVVLLDPEGRVLRPALVGADDLLQIDADWLARDFGGRRAVGGGVWRRARCVPRGR